MARAYFDDAGEALIGFLPRDLRGFSARAGSHNLKVWFGDETHEHYEIQRLSRAALAAGGIKASKPGLEIGFHAEHPDESANDAAIATLLAKERSWRNVLGKDAIAGVFAGRQKGWRRLSEIWSEGDLESGESAIEAAERLSAYIRALEPVRVVTRKL